MLSVFVAGTGQMQESWGCHNLLQVLTRMWQLWVMDEW